MGAYQEYVAVDLGASNGRTILGRFDGEKVMLSELNRFENNYVNTAEGYYWDVLTLYTQILSGLRCYVKNGGTSLVGMGIDTWGVDFGLIDRQGKLIGNPGAYRDPRGARGRKAFHSKYGERMAFDRTGISNMDFNTLYQLYDMAQRSDPHLEIADKLLLMPDLLGYMLSGVMSTEYTNAATTQMLDYRNKTWSGGILTAAGLSSGLFTDIQMSGEEKGKLLPLIQQEAGLVNTAKVFCVGSHDTASAIASVPAGTENFAFLSSGTWSLIGILTPTAITGDFVFENGFSNEGACRGGVQLLRNIMGLWIIQNCKREWDKTEILTWDDIVEAARLSAAFGSFIDVNADDFYSGDNTPQKIQEYCKTTGQSVPGTMGQIARCVFESLAMDYKEAFLGLEKLKGGRIDVLHIVGGGSKNALLNQFAANAIGREVIAGPAEATAIGNVMLQVKASGGVTDMSQMRQVIGNSFETRSFEPQEPGVWEEQYQKYRQIIKR